MRKTYEIWVDWADLQEHSSAPGRIYTYKCRRKAQQALERNAHRPLLRYWIKTIETPSEETIL